MEDPFANCCQVNIKLIDSERAKMRANHEIAPNSLVWLLFVNGMKQETNREFMSHINFYIFSNISLY